MNKYVSNLVNENASCGGEKANPLDLAICYWPVAVKIFKGPRKAAEQPCGKLLVCLIKEWLLFYDQVYGTLSSDQIPEKWTWKK